MGQSASSTHHNDDDGDHDFFRSLDLSSAQRVVSQLSVGSSQFDTDARIMWKEYFTVMFGLQVDLGDSGELFSRNQWSPVCLDYAMSREARSETTSSSSPQPQYENSSPSIADDHTDDDQSVEGSYEQNDGASSSSSQSRNVEVEQPNDTLAARLHPVFFGYSTESLRHQQEKRQLSRTLQQEREDRAMERAIQARLIALNQMEEQFRQQKQNRVKRIQQVKAEYEEESRRRQAEYEKNTRGIETGLAASIKAQHERVQQLHNIAFEREIQELIAKNDLKSDEDAQSLTRKRAELAALEDSQQFDNPIGSRLKDFSKTEILRCSHLLSDSMSATQRLSNELLLLKAELKDLVSPNDPKVLRSKQYLELRSMVNVAETRLKEAIKTLSSCKIDVRDAEALLLRASTLEKHENAVLPLFKRLCTYELNFGSTVPSSGCRAVVFYLSVLLLCRSSFEMKCNAIFSLFNGERLGLFDVQFVLSVGRWVFFALQALGFVRSSVTLREVENQIVRGFLGFSQNFRSDHISEYEVKLLLTSFVSKDVFLMKLFGVTSVGNTSGGGSGVGNYQLSQMSSIGQISGVLDKRIVINRVHFQLQKHCSSLEPIRKRAIHDQALSLGQLDELRADYSIFLTKKEKSGSYFVIPLDTGVFTSTTYHQEMLLLKAVIKLQSFARSLLHRKLAERNSKRIAFNEAKMAVMKQLKNRILKEFQQREASKGMGKMKWDTEVRMKQAKLRSQGQNLSRNDTVMLMIEEAISLAKAQIDARFEQFQPPAEKTQESISEHVQPPLWEQFGLPFTVETHEFGAEEQEEDEQHNIEEASPHKDAASHVLSGFFRYWDLQATQGREGLLLHIGEEFLLRIFRVQMGAAEVESLKHLFNRFTLGPSTSRVTEFKTQEILREFPSKRLLVKYILANQHSGALKSDLIVQFKFRDSPMLKHQLEFLHNMARFDFEAGILNRRGMVVEQNLEKLLIESSLFNFRAMFGESWNRLSEKSDDAEVEEEEQRLVSLQTKLMNDSQTNIVLLNEQRKKVRFLSMSLKRLREHTLAIRSHFSPELQRCSSEMRFNWMWRVQQARRVLKSQILRPAIDELTAAIDEFRHFSSTIARVVVEELFRDEQEKTIHVVNRSTVGGRGAVTGRGVRGNKFIFEACNIFFVVALDYDGTFNGSDDFAAKVAGKERLGAQLLSDLEIVQLSPCLTATIDYFGFRVVATARVPLSHVSFGEDGFVQKEFEEVVHGIDKKGLNFVNKSKKTQELMRMVGEGLNLRSQRCKGKLDAAPSSSYSAQLKVYKGSDGNFYARQCSALFPHELSSDSQLVSAPRNQSIFWRFFRPEFTRNFPQPLPVDAGSIITAQMDDEQRNVELLQSCSAHIQSNIRSLAEYLIERNFVLPDTINEYLSLSNEFHRRGVSIRHVGKLRSLLWRKLPAKVSVFHHEQFLRTTADLRLEVDLGEYILVEGVKFTVKNTSGNRFAINRVPLDCVFNGDSVHRVEAWAGSTATGDLVANENLSALLLAEMIARALKGIIRLQLRQYCERNKTVSSLFFRELISEYLNCVSGSSAKTEELFQNILPSAITERFGSRALRPHESCILFQRISSARCFVIRRLSEMLGFRLVFSCLTQFEKEPGGFVFNRDDVSAPEPSFRSSVSDSPFLQAVSVFFAAEDIAAGAYSKRIAEDAPLIFYTFAERRGSRSIMNKGILGNGWAGAVADGCLLELPGPIKGEKFVRAIGFRSVAPSFVDVKYHKKLVPQDPKQPFSMELFFRCSGVSNAQRTIVASGRYAIRVTRDEHLVFSLFEDSFVVNVKIDKISSNFWTHIVATFDGIFLRIYKDGFISSEVHVPPMFERKRQRFEQEHRDKIEALRLDEQREKDALREKVIKEASHFFQSKDGVTTLKRMTQVILDLEEEDIELVDDSLSGADRVRERKAMAVKKAKEKYIEESLQSQIREVGVRFKQMLLDIEDQHSSILRDAKLKSFEPFRLGAALPDANNRTGSEYFDGDITCFSVYDDCLIPDRVRVHFNASKRNFVLDANRLFARSVAHFNSTIAEVADVQENHAHYLDFYAKALCFLLCFDVQERDSRDVLGTITMLLKLIEKFGKWKKLEAIAYILNNLPRDQEFAEIVVACVLTIKSVDKNFLSKNNSLQRRTMIHFPFEYSLISPSRPSAFHEAAAFIFQEVVRDVDLMFVYGDVDLRWIGAVKSAKLVIALVRAAFEDKSTKMVRVRQFFIDGGDPRMMLCDDDVQVMSENLSLTEGFDFTDCSTITNDSMESLARMGNIRVLILDNCTHISDKGFQALRIISSKFETLSIEQLVQVSDASFRVVLGKCSKLKHLNVNKCPLVSLHAVTEAARGNINLEVLGLSGLLATDESLMLLSSELKKCRITSLDLSNCSQMTDLGLIAIADACGSLKSVNLYENSRLSTEGVRVLCCRCWALESVRFEGLFMLTDDVFNFSPTIDGRAAANDKMLSSLRDLNIKNCDLLTDQALFLLGERCRSMASLNLRSCKKITDKGLSYLADPLLCPSASQPLCLTIKLLDLSFVTAISSSGLLEALRECKNLETFAATGLVRVVDDLFLKRLGGICPSIQNLCIGLCVSVSDIGLCSIAESLWIEQLDLSGCYKVSDMGIEVLASCCTGIKKIDFSKCKRITTQSVILLKKNCPNLLELIGEMSPMSPKND